MGRLTTRPAVALAAPLPPLSSSTVPAAPTHPLLFMPLFVQVGTTSRNVLCHFCLTRKLGKSLLNTICCPPSPSEKSVLQLPPASPFTPSCHCPSRLVPCLLLHPHTWHSAWQRGSRCPGPGLPAFPLSPKLSVPHPLAHRPWQPVALTWLPPFKSPSLGEEPCSRRTGLGRFLLASKPGSQPARHGSVSWSPRQRPAPLWPEAGRGLRPR